MSGTTLAEVRTEDELAAARAGLGGIPAVELAGRGQVTLANLLARLRDGCDILYLVAHGMIVDGEPQILLEQGGRRPGLDVGPGAGRAAGRAGAAAQPGGAGLLPERRRGDGQWLSQDGGALAGLGPRLAAAGVPAVVAMQGNLTMDTAAAFMPLFLARAAPRRPGGPRHGRRARRGARAAGLVDAGAVHAVDRRPALDAVSPDALPEIARQDFEPETIYIPSGPFLMGTDDPAAPAWEQPQHCVDLPAYRIGRKPVSRARVCRVHQAAERPSCSRPAGSTASRRPAGYDHPVTEVSWFDALAYCAWLSEANGHGAYTLPSEAQWERACGHERSRGHAGRAAAVDLFAVGHASRSSPISATPMNPADGREITDPHHLPAQAWLVHRGGSFKSQPPSCAAPRAATPCPTARSPGAAFASR